MFVTYYFRSIKFPSTEFDNDIFYAYVTLHKYNLSNYSNSCGRRFSYFVVFSEKATRTAPASPAWGEES